ncbi:MAG TPA: P-loop NTPase, partial [Wenzhouxiangella sp.]|nr:P-loop NTPase [Wenzhouxiangella sp.]
MNESLQQRIEQIVVNGQEEALGADFAGACVQPDVAFDEGKVSVALEVAYPARRFGRRLASGLKKTIEALPDVEQATVKVTSNIKPHQVQPNVDRLQVVKNIIAVSSAKGGVGKSTVSANLALALAAEGAKV